MPSRAARVSAICFPVDTATCFVHGMYRIDLNSENCFADPNLFLYECLVLKLPWHSSARCSPQSAELLIYRALWWVVTFFVSFLLAELVFSLKLGNHHIVSAGVLLRHLLYAFMTRLNDAVFLNVFFFSHSLRKHAWVYLVRVMMLVCLGSARRLT